MPTNKCIICAVSFRSWQEYNQHMAEHLKADSPLAPIKSSNRTHDQIVADMEAEPWLAPFLIGVGKPLPPPSSKAKKPIKVEIVQGFNGFAEEVINDQKWVG